MFTSRSQIHQDAQRFQTIFIELDRKSEVDKDVTPAALELVLDDVLSDRRLHGFGAPATTFLAVARPPTDFAKLIDRCAISSSNVLDGFSEWYPTEKVDDNTLNSGDSNRKGAVHIGAFSPSSNEKGAVVREILDVLQIQKTSNDSGVVIAIDSLAPLLRLWPDLSSLLDIQDLIFSNALVGVKGSATFISTFFTDELTPTLLFSLRKLADTSVRVSQYTSLGDEKSLLIDSRSVNHRDQVALNVCKCKASGRVQLDNYVATMNWEAVRLSDVKHQGNPACSDTTQAKGMDGHQGQEDLLAQLGLSFRVSLSVKEKEMRAAAGLPYLHDNEQLADSALHLHPEELQVGGHMLQRTPVNSDGEGESSDDEDLFSEDV